MDAARWTQVCDIFEAVEAAPPDARDAVLDQACAGDPELRAEVLSLLSADDADGGFLTDLSDFGVSVSTVLADVVADEADITGRLLGPWQILEEIGRGGMGTVFLARRADGLHQQRVAVKVVHRAALSPVLRRRFERERRLLGRLEHPGIARLLDGGVSSDGVPYLVMEYVAGQPIHHYCDTHRLDVAARLRLFIDVCEAVQVAHAGLVVHRDLKPSNILVQGPPERAQPKLLDFGIAKLMDGERRPAGGDGAALTVTGVRPFTPEYAAPEQVRGETVTTATDVYGLGVLLFELLTGVRPFPQARRPIHEVESDILHADPPRPSAVLRAAAASVPRSERGSIERQARRVRGDLDTIVATALAKEPERRYASVGRLEADLARHLEGLPIAARRDTLRYRTGKFVRRHRWGVGASAVLLLVLLTAAALVSLQSARAARERDKAVQTAEFLTELIAGIDPAQGGTASARALLDRGAEQLRDGTVEAPEMQATLQRALGRVYAHLGEYAEAERLLRSALRTRLALYEPAHPDVNQSRVDLAAVLTDQSDYAEAERLLRDALAAVPSGDPLEAAAVMHELGRTLTEASDFEAAEPLLRQALRTRQRRAPQNSLLPTQTEAVLAHLLHRRGSLEEAETLYRRVADRYRAEFGPNHPQVGRAVGEVGVIVKNRGEYEQAEALYREALAIFRTAYGERHPEVAKTLSDLGNLLKDIGLLRGDRSRFDEAEPLLTRSLELYRTLHGEAHLRVGHTEAHLGHLALARGNGAEAEALLRAAVATHDAAELPVLHTARAYPLTGLGEALVLQGRPDEALEPLREALSIRETLTPGHWRLAEVECALGAALSALGHPGAARTHLHNALAIVEAGQGEAQRLRPTILARLAAVRDR